MSKTEVRPQEARSVLQRYVGAWWAASWVILAISFGILAVIRERDAVTITFVALSCLVVCYVTMRLFGVDLPVVRMFCPKCDKFIASNSAWKCGSCGHGHVKETTKHPFIMSCVQCGRAPGSVMCPHCNAVLSLAATGESSVPAKILGVEAIGPADSTKSKHEAHLERKTQLEQEIEIAALNTRLNQLKASAEFKQEVSARERIEKDFSNFEAGVMGVQMLERTERRKIADAFKDDPDLREMKDLALDAFIESHGLTPTRISGE